MEELRGAGSKNLGSGKVNFIIQNARGNLKGDSRDRSGQG